MIESYSDREGKFLQFVMLMLGTSQEAPLKDANGAMVGALVDAFKALNPAPVQAAAMQSFDDPVYSEPWTVYVIRNTVTSAAYVGLARNGFRDRYPNGWWTDHHNERLSRDAAVYGAISFRVSIYVCVDDADMRRQEAEMMRALRHVTYNIKREQDNT
jgi:hypothetical protein